MFNLRRLLLFLWHVLEIVIPFLLVALLLAFGAEMLSREDKIDALTTVGFWLAVIVDMLPVIAAMVLTLWLAARFLQALYRLDGWTAGMDFLLSSRCGLRGFGPWFRIQEGEAEKSKATVLDRIGGPGNLVIYNDSAAVLERGGRLTRVVGSGFPRLEAFDRVYDVVDLRPKRWVRAVSAMTRDGIPISWEAEIRYQIDNRGIASTEDAPYPMSPDSVLLAATRKWVQIGDQTRIVDWEEQLILAETEGNLRSILGSRRLDQLIGLTEDAQRAARESVRAELEGRLHKAAKDLGAKVLGVRLDNLKVDGVVTQEWIKAWRARWQRWSAGQLAQAEASYVHLYEIAKAESQMQMIVRIAEALQKQIESQALSPKAIPQMILMRLYSVLDRADFASASRLFFPAQTIDALQNIQQALAPGTQAATTAITLTVVPTTIQLRGQADLDATVRDAWGIPAPDGTLVEFATTLGTVSPSSTVTAGGHAGSTLVAGNQPGLALVTAKADSAAARATVNIV